MAAASPFGPRSALSLAFGAAEPRVRARQLVAWRWLAMAGQGAALLAAHLLLGFETNIAAAALAVTALGWFNVAALLVLPANARLSESAALGWLLFDAAQLAVLLALTGGLSNPFAMLFIAPTLVAAAVLTPRATAIAAGASVVMILALYTHFTPLRREDGAHLLELPEIHRGGVACALLIGVAFVSVHVRRLADEARSMAEALAATQDALAREQRLSALGALAAAAAHELGTPLATIALTAKELERDLKEEPELAADMRLIREQTARCRDILAQLARDKAADLGPLGRAPLSALIEEAAAPVRAPGKTLELRGEAMAEPALRSPETLHALRNFLQNAMDFAASRVRVEAELTGAGQLRLRVTDDGPGFSPEALARLGEPYASTRAREEGAAPRDGYEGMGLGVFIAKTLLERSGARVAFANARAGRRARETGDMSLDGAAIEIVWPPGAILEA